ncbi:MAG: hypothetical protein R6V50_06450 [Thermoplasmatota archaeon]
MYSFTKNQKIFSMADIEFGGQPGMNPTVLFAGLFFKGKPDIVTAKQQIVQMNEISKNTGIPAIPDFFIKKEEYVQPIINFITDTLESDSPFSIDIIEPSIKIQVLELLEKHDLLSRCIYNSIHVGITKEERVALEQYTPEMVILVAFNPKDSSPDGKIEVLENGAHLTESGLLQIACDIGCKKVLVDTAALAPGNNSGGAIAALPVIKEEYGLPAGCAIHNVVEKSGWLDSFSKVRDVVDVSSNVNIPLFGGDFALFGSIDLSSMVFPVIAWQNILISEYVENYFGISPSRTHPRRILQ